MKRRILTVMLAGALALQGSVWTAAAEEEILLVEDLGDSLLSGDAPAAEDEEVPEDQIILEEETISNMDQNPEAGETAASDLDENLEIGEAETETDLSEITIEELDLADDPGYVQVQEEAVVAEAENVAINEKNFPDKIFREYVSLFDENGNERLESGEIKAITGMKIDYGGVTDLKGIEFFKFLTELDCGSNELSSLDVSGNPLLTSLSCEENRLSSLDLSGNPALTYLNCTNNQLGSLDLSKNQVLNDLICNNTLQVPTPVLKDGIWQMNLTDYVGAGNLDRVTIVSEGASLSGETVFFGSTKPTSLVYKYDTKAPLVPEGLQMKVILIFPSDTESSLKDVGINEENFPDKVFKGYVKQFDKNKNGILEANEIEAVTEVAVAVNTSYKGRIGDLKGIEFFKSVTKLYCSGNWLDSLDVGDNPLLTTLSCGGNQLSSLDVSGKPSLTYLDCGYNQLGTLDVSGNPLLTDLHCSSNQLKSLDVSGNPSLTSLSCGDNQLSSLDLSKNQSLYYLDCGGNTLHVSAPVQTDGIWQINLADYVGPDHLDRVTLVSEGASLSGEMVLFGNTKPTELIYKYDTKAPLLSESSRQMEVTLKLSGMESAEINEENFPDEVFREYVERFDLDGSGTLETDELDAITTMDIDSDDYNISDLKGIEFFKSLVSLRYFDGQLSSLDVSGNPFLTYLECEYNQLGTLDVSGNPFLKKLRCEGNQLSSLDVSGNPSLTELRCGGNQLSSLDVSGNPSLTYLECGCDQLSSLDVSGNPSLTTLYCNGSQLSSLDVSNNPSLTYLQCGNNELRTLDVSGNPSLTELDCWENQLDSLDVKNNANLKELICRNNQLKSLDVRNNASLEWLDCGGNQLSSLDVSGNPSLTDFWCDQNQLISLDVSGNPLLVQLWCEINQLSSLDVSGNLLLRTLCFSGNQLRTLDLSKNQNLEVWEVTDSSNTFQVPAPVQVDGIWQMNLADYVGAGNLDRVTILSEGASLLGEMVLFGSAKPTKLIYQYDTKAPLSPESTGRYLEVTMKFPDNVECDEHHMVMVADQEATCVTPGSQHRECKKCGYKEAPTEIPATGAHSFGAYIVTKAATVLEEGTQTRKCSVCGKTESTPLAKLVPQIMVSEEKVTLKTGQTTKLEVSGLAEGDSVASWESSNKKVVKVDGEGKLTAQKKAGTAVVTITLASGLEKEIQVTVQKTKVETKKISGLPKTVTLKKGKKLTLKPVITPATSQDKVTYKSSDKKIATVSGKGVVKGKKAGKAKITVTSGKKKAVVTVKVKK